jgi:acyl-CoA thioester hydrolase
MMERYNAMLVVRRIEVAYVRPARLDDLLIVETRIRALRAATLDLDQRVIREGDGAELARLLVGLVCVQGSLSGPADAAEGLKPARIPEPWRTSLSGKLAEQGD